MRQYSFPQCCGAWIAYNYNDVGVSTEREHVLRSMVREARRRRRSISLILSDFQVAKGGGQPEWAGADAETKRAHLRKVLKELGFKKVARWENGVHDSMLNLFVYHSYEGSQRLPGW